MPEGSSSSFTPAHYFPSRRRVWQACTNCRTRKTRCDAAKPKCSLCMTQGVDCVYSDSQQPKIEHNTRILLERIQMLEDRILAAPGIAGVTNQTTKTDVSSSENASRAVGDSSEQNRAATGQQSTRAFEPTDLIEETLPGMGRNGNALSDDSEIPIPFSHTASANHVFDWPIVQQLLAETKFGRHRQQSSSRNVQSTGATDIFFLSDQEIPTSRNLGVWSLETSDQDVDEYRRLTATYFEEVNVFYPLLSYDSILQTLEAVYATERFGEAHGSVAIPEYCLLLLVICLGDFMAQGQHQTTLSPGSEGKAKPNPMQKTDSRHMLIWPKAQLMLGTISSLNTLEAAQCSMLASFYMGALGKVAASFHWAHATAVKCEAIAKRTLLTSPGPDAFSEAFRRLYWVALIYESDYISEISITLPSGISRYEDLVPYPANTTFSRRHNAVGTPNSESNTPGLLTYDRTEALVAFQISTNAAIRRFLNRVNSVVYDSKDRFRMTRSSYANWLLRTTEDLWSYHGAIYKNLPDFLLKSQPVGTPGSGASPGDLAGSDGMGNNPWNVRRLEGRYYAGQYIIHRPFIEYVLLNMEHFASHPCREAILERGRMCLLGCRGFINVFDVDPANSVTCLFAAGMVTFTMVIILRVATICPLFAAILLDDTEHVIGIGKRNLQRFSASIKEFEWHLDVLQTLDEACRRQGSAG